LSFVDLSEQKGSQPCLALLFLLQEGKTNKVRRKEFIELIQHKNLLLCFYSVLAQYLFWCFYVSSKEPLSFQSCRAWYNTRLLVTTVSTAKATANQTSAKRKSQRSKPGGGE
jgi:hypothetical protein